MNPQTGIKLVELNELTNQRIDLMQAKIDHLAALVWVLVVIVLAHWAAFFLWRAANMLAAVRVGAVDYDTWRQINGKGKP